MEWQRGSRSAGLGSGAVSIPAQSVRAGQSARMAAAATGHVHTDVGPEHRHSGVSLAAVNPLHADSADAAGPGQVCGLDAQASKRADGTAAATRPALPRDVMLAIARTALAAEGHSLHARARLSLVCAAWRHELKGTLLLFAAQYLFRLLKCLNIPQTILFVALLRPHLAQKVSRLLHRQTMSRHDPAQMCR